MTMQSESTNYKYAYSVSSVNNTGRVVAELLKGDKSSQSEYEEKKKAFEELRARVAPEFLEKVNTIAEIYKQGDELLPTDDPLEIKTQERKLNEIFCEISDIANDSPIEAYYFYKNALHALQHRPKGTRISCFQYRRQRIEDELARLENQISKQPAQTMDYLHLYISFLEKILRAEKLDDFSRQTLNLFKEIAEDRLAQMKREM